MARRVDQEARRQQIVEAVWRVTRDRGLRAASLRHVAAEAGISVGLVQHYFRDKDQMLLFALDSLIMHLGRRIARGIAALAEADDPRALARAMLIERLPLDAERALQAHVASAFLSRAAVDRSVAARLRADHARGHAFLVAQLRRRGVEQPVREATMLLALVDGLTLHTLAGDHRPDGALAVLDAALDGLMAVGAAIGGGGEGVRDWGREVGATAQLVGGGRER
ncbi:MAG: TetR/AcrR family transcriptional regulator [Candidatus Dormibacteria bacterium]